MNILALIPARSGSKGIAHKNIASFHGKPLLAHSIKQSLQSATVNRVIVSTDSELYANIAREYGAEVPFLRPANISGDLSTDLEAFQHALDWLETHEGYQPDICVHLRPTSPTRSAKDIDRGVRLLQDTPGADSVRSLVEPPDTPYKMWRIQDNGFLKPAMDPATSGFSEPWNSARQALPKVYLQSASVDVVWTRTIVEQSSMTGRQIVPMLMDRSHDIDDAAHFADAVSAASPTLIGKTFVFDIDGVIATLTPGNNYQDAEPIKPTIDLINRLYEAGNTIHLFTARGTMTGIDWAAVTREQMQRWGVKYHHLQLGKPAADYYIDDRFISLVDLGRLAETLPVEEATD